MIEDLHVDFLLIRNNGNARSILISILIIIISHHTFHFFRVAVSNTSLRNRTLSKLISQRCLYIFTHYRNTFFPRSQFMSPCNFIVFLLQFRTRTHNPRMPLHRNNIHRFQDPCQKIVRTLPFIPDDLRIEKKTRTFLKQNDTQIRSDFLYFCLRQTHVSEKFRRLETLAFSNVKCSPDPRINGGRPPLLSSRTTFAAAAAHRQLVHRRQTPSLRQRHIGFSAFPANHGQSSPLQLSTVSSIVRKWS